MKLGFNTTGNNQTDKRITKSILLGKLRNTVASTTRKFKFCNQTSSDLNVTFNCVFNGLSHVNEVFSPYCILNQELPYEILDNKNTQTTKSTISGPFRPENIKIAYSINNIIPINNVRKSIVTIISAYNNPYLLNDVKKFGTIFGLPRCDIKIYNFSQKFSVGWAVETTLDVQYVYAMNPYAHIRVILAATNGLNDVFNAIKYANNKNNFYPPIDTDIMNFSFGIPDNYGVQTYNNYFSNTNTIYLAASGDSSITSFPSSSPNIVSIGGTTLNLNGNDSRLTETVWSRSGCGFSKAFLRPSYQPKLANNNFRVTPDICCVANPKTPCYIILNNRLYSVGGTSLSSAIYSGIFSLITQQRLNDKKHTYTSIANKYNSIQPLLYNLLNTNSLYDITKGTSGNHFATNSFDIASGLGVINVDEFIKTLN